MLLYNYYLFDADDYLPINPINPISNMSVLQPYVAFGEECTALKNQSFESSCRQKTVSSRDA